MSEAGKQAMDRPEEASPSSSLTLVYQPCRQRTRLSLDRMITSVSQPKVVGLVPGQGDPMVLQPSTVAFLYR